MYPFRLGTTSYIIPDDILPNVRFLAGRVQDIQLILFEVDDGPNNLPAPEVVAELARLARAHGLSYTVHLPLDLKLGAEGAAADVSMVKAGRVIDCTMPLDPWAYVLHLDGKELRSPEGAFPPEDRPEVRAWQDRSVRALEIVGEWVGGPGRLAVENLERYPPGFILPVLDRVPVSRCVDIGHLWLDGHDAVPHLLQALPRTRVVHVHGVADRDHKSLAHVPPEKLETVVGVLLEAGYAGVVTLEIFNEEDFHSSREALERAVAAVSGYRIH